tara:strand:+ start:381 stop:542 length:162 start_codon:yes stop_codon:yes gene_type:complete
VVFPERVGENVSEPVYTFPRETRLRYPVPFPSAVIPIAPALVARWYYSLGRIA